MKSIKLLNFIISVVVVVIIFSSCTSKESVLKNNISLDYSNQENWMKLEQNPTHEADLIYIYPTVAKKCQNGISIIDEEYKKNVQKAYAISGSAFSEYTNVYIPYYRQVTLSKVFELKSIDNYIKFIKQSVVKTDIYAALDYYFKNLNKGRPFILSGYSQGSMMVRLILSDYMKKHPEYLKQMVVAYIGGFSITKDWLEENPQVKFAQGETDTNVIVSWNTEGPNATLPNFVVEKGAITINLLNWKRDETPASIEKNKGSLDKKTMKIVDGVADATIDLKRGVIVCRTQTNYFPKVVSDFFGDKSFHMDEYSFYYQNIKENGKKRIDAFLGHEAK